MTSTFAKYIGTPFEKSIKPTIPPGAKLAPRSKIDPANLGKIPGIRTPKGWVGMPREILAAPSRPKNLEVADSWGTNNVVLRGGDFIGIDIDTDDRALANHLERLAIQHLGLAPIRGRPGSCHCLLVYRLAEGAGPIKKQTLSWRMPGDDPSRTKSEHMLEILGQNCNMMVEGVHTSDRPYEYKHGKDLYSWGAENLAVIDGVRLMDFIEAATAAIEDGGCTIVNHSVGGSTNSERREIGDPALLAPSVEAAIEALSWIPCEELDRDDWVRVTAAFKAATGGVDEAYQAYVDWSLNYEANTDEAIDAMWGSIQEASLGAGWLFSYAAEWGFDPPPPSYFDALDEEDEAVGGERDHYDDAASPANGEIPADAGPTDQSMDDGPAPQPQRWEKRFAYVEPLKEFVDLSSPNLQLYDLLAFKNKFPAFDPWNSKKNAVMRYLRSDKKTIRDGYTYLPGAPRLVEEDGRRLLNRWSPGLELPKLPVSDDDIRAWLDHVEYIVPDPIERAILLNWSAHLVQRIRPKVNYALLLGGPQGIGKSLLFDPITRVLGRGNVRTTSETEIKDKFTSWVAERELVMMEEIRGLSDEVMNRLKMYIAAPPYMVPVNEKNVKHYEVPNVARFVAFTNSEYALQPSDDDRRWCIIWSSAEPKEPAYYTNLAKWCEQNAGLVGGWLALRDLSGFEAHGRAPMTEAKCEMRLAAMGSLDHWVYQAIANRRPPFEHDLVTVEEVLTRLPYDSRELKPTATEKSISMALKNAGALKLGRFSLGKVLEATGSSRAVLWAIRRQPLFRKLSRDPLVGEFWKERAERRSQDTEEILSGFQEKAA